MDGFRVRTLQERERYIPTKLRSLPLVLEPSSEREKANLDSLIAANSVSVKTLLDENGVLLFRGFNIASEIEFENAVGQFPGMQGMKNYFMSEPGRVLFEKSELVFYTNKDYKTGGAITLGNFHTENHYSTDVPGYICFWCSKPSALGGETGLVKLDNVFEELSDSLKRKITARSYLAATYSIEKIAMRYGIAQEQVAQKCRDAGLSLLPTANGDTLVLVYKPAVIHHPITGKPALVGNLSGEIVDLDPMIQKKFNDAYQGGRWFFHRLIWRYPFLRSFLSLYNFRILIKKVFRSLNPTGRSKPAIVDPFAGERLGSVFEKADVDQVAHAMRGNFVSFGWKHGDLLIVDNLRFAHSGMPGFGSRLLRVILCNRVQLDTSMHAKGHQFPQPSKGAINSLVEELTGLLAR